jgi:hypothetical protein
MLLGKRGGIAVPWPMLLMFFLGLLIAQNTLPSQTGAEKGLTTVRHFCVTSDMHVLKAC